MRKIKNIVKKSCLLYALLAMCGCNSWLDINPTGVQTSDTYWQTKEEVEQVLTSSYIQLRTCMPYFFRWGELRADELDYGMTQSTDASQLGQDERSLRTMDIRPSNVLNDWSSVYKAIGRANSVIQFAETALETDITFSRELCNSYIAEAIFVRSLCYFYLVRTFKDVPYITEAYADDEQEFAVPKADGDYILEQVIQDLEKYVRMCKPGYEVEWQTKGRATCWAFYALMADIYLWQENYGQVLEKCSILEKAGFDLEEKAKYWENFYPGNSKKESIFELQFRHNTTDNQKNSLFSWFSAGVSDARYLISEDSKRLFEEEDVEDIRGKGYMYDNRYIGEKYWKYLGTASRSGLIYPDSRLRGTTERSPNWIFYRYAEIILMKAEAMTMQGTPYDQICRMLDTTIRRRAGYDDASKLAVPETEEEMLKIVLNERRKEFLAEGKRWFDVVRMGQKQGYKYRSYFTQVALKYVSAKDRPMWKVKLENSAYGFYLPILKSEIEASHGVLTQNPFYEDVE